MTCLLYFQQVLRSATSIYFCLVSGTHKACISHLRLEVKKIAMWVNRVLQTMERIYSKRSRETLEMIKKRLLQEKLDAYSATNQLKRLNTRMHNVCTKKRARSHASGHADVCTPVLAHPPLQMSESHNMLRYKRKINVNASTASSSPFLFLSPVTFSQTIQECTSSPPTHKLECVRGSMAKHKCN